MPTAALALPQAISYREREREIEREREAQREREGTKHLLT